MKKVIIFLFIILYSFSIFGQQRLVLAKLEGVNDQYLGEVRLKEVYAKLGIEVEFKVLPAARALVNSREGIIDGEIQRITVIEESSPTLIRIPTPISHVDLCVFARVKIPYTGLENLGENIFVYVRGVKIYESFLKYFDNSIPVTIDAQMWKLINLKRADVALAGRVNGQYTIKNLGFDGIYPLEPPYQTIPLYHYLNEKHKDLIPKIDKVLKEMSESGELKSIREKAVNDLLSSIQKN